MNDPKTQPSSAIPISVGAVSEVGQREQNQDCMTGFSSPFGAVYLIADGMGGHRGGAEASRMVAEAFNRHLLAVPASSPLRDAVTLAVRLANVEVLEKGKSGNPEFEGMGSTVVIALVRQNGNQMELTTAHIGDSRIYLQRNGKLNLLTKDHTQVQWLIDTHALDEASARNHPDASVLTRAMGHTTDLQIDISEPIPLQQGDGILMCSDGLSGFASAEDIIKTIQQNADPSGCANQLVQLALASGSNDNITVQFLRIGSAALTPPRERARKTQPDGSPQRAGSFVRNPSRWISIVAMLLVVAAIVWWVRSHRKPNPVVDQAVSQLTQPVKDLLANATVLHDKAQEGKNAVHQDLADLEKLGAGADKSASLKKALKDLKDKLPPLEKKFDDILEKSGGLIQSARTDDTELDVLERPAPPSQKPSESQARIEKLKRAIHDGEDQLREQVKKLDLAKAAQAELATQKSKLEKDWSAAPAHAVSHPPGSSATVPKPGNAPKNNETGDVHH